MPADRNRNASKLLILASAYFIGACAHELPPRVGDATSGIAADGKIDSSLRSAATSCASRLDTLRDDASSLYSKSDALTVGGGAGAAVGGGLATAIQAFSSSPDKATTVVGTAVGLTGGLVALLSKTVEDPGKPLTKRAQAEKHYIAGLKALNVLIFESDREDPRGRVFKRYAADEFQQCLLESPSDGVPPMPTAEALVGKANDGRVGATAEDAGATAQDGGVSPVDDAGARLSRADAGIALTRLPAEGPLSAPACIAACQALCERHKAGTSAEVGHFCSSTGDGWKACTAGRCNDRAFLNQ